MSTIERVISIGAVFFLGGFLSHCASSSPTTPMPDLGGPTMDLAHLAGPKVTMASPALAINSGGWTLTLSGTGFVSGATVSIGGAAATEVTVVSPTQLTCIVPAKPQTCGLAAVVVTNPDGQLATANNLFSYFSGSFGYGTAQSLAANSVSSPAGIAVGELSGDGKPDLVVSSLGAALMTSTVTVLLGAGGASFVNSLTTPVLIQPRGVVLADFTGDNKLDLAVANSGSNDVSLLTGSGSGTLSFKGQANAGIGANSLAVGDFDGDGKTDLAVANNGTVQAGGSVTVLLGVGDGTFKLQQTLGAGTATNSIVARDVNGDKHIDLISGSSVGVDVFINDGTGSFASSVRFMSGTAVAAVGAADLDSLGNLDVFAISGTNVNVLLNAGGTGAGLFGAAKSVATGGTAPVATLAADFDNDGKIDLATANSTSNDVSVLLSNGGGLFAAPKIFSIAPGGTGPRGLVSADLNADGTLDLVTANATTGNISVLLSQCL